jgi:hypothetical protein
MNAATLDVIKHIVWICNHPCRCSPLTKLMPDTIALTTDCRKMQKKLGTEDRDVLLLSLTTVS